MVCVGHSQSPNLSFPPCNHRLCYTPVPLLVLWISSFVPFLRIPCISDIFVFVWLTSLSMTVSRSVRVIVMLSISCFLNICISASKQRVFRSSTHFLTGLLLFSWYWATWAVCAFWRLILSQLLYLQIFSPTVRVVLSSCLWFPLLYKSF